VSQLQEMHERHFRHGHPFFFFFFGKSITESFSLQQEKGRPPNLVMRDLSTTIDFKGNIMRGRAAMQGIEK